MPAYGRLEIEALEPRLPACQRCRTRKVKCDGAAPKCTVCQKAGSACVVVDQFTGKSYSREYIYELEQKYESLRARNEFRDASPANVAHEDTADWADGTSPPGRSRVFVGEGSGLKYLNALAVSVQGAEDCTSFLKYVFSMPAWTASRAQLQEQLTQHPRISESNVPENPLPPEYLAHSLVETYLTQSHIHHAFLLRSEVLQSFQNVYGGVQSTVGASSQDHFRLHMIFAISSVRKYRDGVIQQHPYGFYLAAQKHIESHLITGGVQAIQNLLLIARFGIYHHIGTSIWEIARVCMRLCVEWGLHKAPTITISPIQEQLQRRVFWECYVLDRYSSAILGRPFAISDGDIKVLLPAHLSDEDVLSGGFEVLDLSSSLSTETPSATNELSVFIFCVHLRQITSRIHSAFYSPRVPRDHGERSQHTMTAAGKIYVDLHHFLSELAIWRQTAPQFANPRSLYERQEWYDFLLEKDKLSLIRGAMDRAPKRKGLPPEDLRRLCQASASDLVMLYVRMFNNKYITYTRSYYQILFTAGMSIMFCLSVPSQGSTGSPGAESLKKSQQALLECSNILLLISHEMPDAKPFAIVFEMLRRSFSLSQHIDDQNLGLSMPPIGPNSTTTGLGSELQHGFEEARPTGLEGQPIFREGNENSFPVSEKDWAYNSHRSLPNYIRDPELPVLDWNLFTNDVIGHMEAGLGEYAWGDPDTDTSIWNQLLTTL